ncbi:MAG TPA: DUF1801 domain-containing protein [Polyangiaceae bacterium]|nr:DUF1801 domain-containing protein [Polyangiaceae bacterium]
MKTDPRVDAYLAKSQPFARHILQEIRKRVAKAHASIEETIKWNVPFFLLDGRILASAAAFKRHVKVGVWIGKAPRFQDVGDVADLISAKEFAAQLATAIASSDSAMKSAPTAEASPKVAPAKVTPAKKAAKKPAKVTPATKAAKKPAKKAPAKATPAKVTPAKRAAKKPTKKAAKKAPAKVSKKPAKRTARA